MLVGKNNDELYIYDWRCDIYDAEKYCHYSTINSKNEVESFAIIYKPRKIYVHDHLNHHSVVCDMHYSTYWNPFDITARDEKCFYPENFINKNLLYYVIDRHFNDEKYSWSEIKEQLKWLPNSAEDILERHFPIMLDDETEEEYKGRIHKWMEEPIMYDLEINTKKSIMTLKNCTKKSPRCYLNYSTKEEYEKGWYFNFPKTSGKVYVEFDCQKGIVDIKENL